MTKFIVSYYQRNPLDEQDRWTIKRDTITAENKAEAGDIIAACDCEVIKVETAEELYNQIEVLKAELQSADEGLKLFHSIASNGEQSALSRLDGGADEVDAKRWMNEREPFTVRKVEVPQALRSYASYNNTGKGKVMPAEDVDGERLGE